MNNTRIEINPDILLQLKLMKVMKETGVTMDLAVREAIVDFLSSEGSNNLKNETALA